MTPEQREAKRVYRAAWYQAHKEREAETSREYRTAHRDELLAYNREYKAANKDVLLAYSREYGASIRQGRRNDRQSFLATMKNGLGCADCGARGDLHFHHRDKGAKSFKISSAVLLPWQDLMTEVFKCDVLCDSCHQKRHVELRRTEGVLA